VRVQLVDFPLLLLCENITLVIFKQFIRKEYPLSSDFAVLQYFKKIHELLCCRLNNEFERENLSMTFGGLKAHFLSLLSIVRKLKDKLDLKSETFTHKKILF